MQLVIYPGVSLFENSRSVTNNLDENGVSLREELAASMWRIMSANNGVGLAAPQIGMNIRMFVWKNLRGRQRAIWNPVLEITALDAISRKAILKDSIEGCLSLPGITVTVKRPMAAILSGTDVDGKPIKIAGNHGAARIWQHEIDHLNGKLIIDDMDLTDQASNTAILEQLIKENHRLTE